MATTRGPAPTEPWLTVEQANADGYVRARKAGMLHAAALLAAAHPEYWLYYRRIPPMDFQVAFSSRDGINAVLTRLGYDVSDIEEPTRKSQEGGEDIRPKAPNW